MTVVVTGATGHVGANLVRALLERGRSVRAVVRDDSRGVEGLDVERVRADVRDLGSLERAFAGADVVYHLASRITILGDPKGEVQAINVGGARNVAEACLRNGVRRLVHFSSIHALQAQPFDRVIDEERPPADEDPENPAYDRTKALGEKQIRAAVARGLDAVVVNPTAVIGPHDYKLSRMGDVILRLREGRLPSLIPGGFDWVDVRDVCAGAIAAEEKGRTGERYLLSGTYTSIAELAAVVSEVTGARVPRFECPMWLARLTAPAAVSISETLGIQPLYTPEALRALRLSNAVSHVKATRELGYAPRPLRETIEEIFRWRATLP